MTEKVLAAQFKALADHHIYLEGAVLKPNMVKNGLGGPKASAETIATLTVQTLLRTVPPTMPGIFFLSGESAKNEDNEEEATINLSTMNSLFGKLPWHLSFSYGKALQRTCIVTWLGKTENKDAAQKALKARAKANSDACFGKYKAGSCRSLGPDDASSVPAGPYWGVSKWAAAKSLQVLRSTSRLQVPIPAMLSTGFSIATLNHQRVLIPGLVFGGLHLLQAH